MTSTNTAARAITAIAGTRRSVQLYPPTHPAYGEALTELESAIHAAAAETPFVLNVHMGRLYHASTVLPDDVPGLGQVLETLESLGLESVVFQSTFSATDAIALTEILALRPSPELDVAAELSKRGVTSVAVSLLARAGEEAVEARERDVTRDRDQALLRRSVVATRTLLEQVAMGDLSAAGEAHTLSRSIVERMEADPTAVLGMAAGHRKIERQLFHALGVAIHSLTIGHRLGLTADALASLGAAALLHDVGKSGFDSDDPEQLEAIRRGHSLAGAEVLQRLAPVDAAPMLVAYEHHMLADGSGFPSRPQGYVAHPYSRIVMIADRFDNLVCPPAGYTSLTPDRALVQVLRECSTRFDPFLGRLFAAAMGPFPVGSVVRLSDHSVAVVVRPGNDPLTPSVRRAYDARGLEIEEPEATALDLSQGAVRIVEVVSPEAMEINVAEQLL